MSKHLDSTIRNLNLPYLYRFLVVACNEAKTQEAHDELTKLSEVVWSKIKETYPHPGMILMDCDNFYLERGVDRPMCGGRFLEWKPNQDADASVSSTSQPELPFGETCSSEPIDDHTIR